MLTVGKGAINDERDENMISEVFVNRGDTTALETGNKVMSDKPDMKKLLFDGITEIKTSVTDAIEKNYSGRPRVSHPRLDKWPDGMKPPKGESRRPWYYEFKIWDTMSENIKDEKHNIYCEEIHAGKHNVLKSIH